MQSLGSYVLVELQKQKRSGRVNAVPDQLHRQNEPELNFDTIKRTSKHLLKRVSERVWLVTVDFVCIDALPSTILLIFRINIQLCYLDSFVKGM